MSHHKALNIAQFPVGMKPSVAQRIGDLSCESESRHSSDEQAQTPTASTSDRGLIHVVRVFPLQEIPPGLCTYF